MLEQIKGLAQSPHVLERALEHALRKSDANLGPMQTALTQIRSALQQAEQQIEALMDTLTAGAVTPALLQLVNERASSLKTQRDTLRVEERRLQGQVLHMEQKPEAAALRRVLGDFTRLAQEAEPKELQRLLHLMVRRVTWNPNGERSLRIYNLGLNRGKTGGSQDKNNRDQKKEGIDKAKMSNLSSPLSGENWFDISMWNDSPNLRNVEPVWLEFFLLEDTLQTTSTLFGASLSCEE